MDKRSGFTILELIIVMAVMAMMMSMALPSLHRSYEKATFKSGVLALQSELHKTRLLAMKTGIPYIFHYCQGTGEYEIVPKEIYQNRYQQSNTASGIAGSLQTPGTDTMDENSSIFSDSTLTETNTNSTLTAPKESSLLTETPTDTVLEEGNIQPDKKSSETMTTESRTEVVVSTGTAESKRAILPDGVLFMNGLVSDMTPANLQKKKSVETEQEIELDLGSSFIGSLHPEEENQTKVSQWSEPILFYPNGRTSQAVIILCNSEEAPYYAEIALRGLTGIARISAIATVPPTDPSFPTVLTLEQLEILRQKESGGTSPESEISPFSSEEIPLNSFDL